MTREELRDYVDEQRGLNNIPYHVYSALIDGIDTLEQEPQSFKWCDTCKEYDQEKHCCHRWSKVIRNTVEEMKQEPVIDKITEIIEPLRHLSIDEMSDIEWDILRVIDKYKIENNS